MSRLVEGLSNFFGRVEILARGLEGVRRSAEIALAQGRPLEARECARALLAGLPGSPLGLALWADAAEDAWLDHEVVAALKELAPLAPWRADVWLRLGRAAQRLGDQAAREALERAAAAPDDRESSRLALLDLCDLDLAENDPARAERWLDRATGAFGPDADVARRRAECALATGDVATARETMRRVERETPTDGREALVRAKLAAADAAPAADRTEGEASAALATAVDFALRAYVLDTRGAPELLASLVARARDAVLVDRIRRVVASAGDLERPSFAAAFAFAEGRVEDARDALTRALSQGDASAAAGLLELATQLRDAGALEALAGHAATLLTPELSALRSALAAHTQGDGGRALDALDAISHSSDVAAWAAEVRRDVAAGWLPRGARGGSELAPARWEQILPELRRSARALDRVDLVGTIEALAVERERPLRAAVMGEFNAGKSTFLNALLGVDVAPTGILPTTATLHWVAWAKDAFARVVLRGAPDRVVPHQELKPTLLNIAAEGGHVQRVYIYAPIERLKRVELLDTPGYNAPNPEHIAAARQAFDEAHVALWLLDATSPLKESERRVLAEVADLGIPVFFLLNKADRLRGADLEQVALHVREGLERSGLAPRAPVVAFSARLSLAGKLGDETALARSGWAEVEALLAAELVDASELLKERALRRRASRVARELSETASARAAGEREADTAARARAASLRRAAAKLSRARSEVAAKVDPTLEAARWALAADLRPLAEIPDERLETDAALRAYVRDRFVTRLGEVVAAELARESELAPVARGGAAVRSVLLGVAAASRGPRDLAARSLVPALEACAEAYAAALLAEAHAPEPAAPFAALAARSEALAQALRLAPESAMALVSEPAAPMRSG